MGVDFYAYRAAQGARALIAKLCGPAPAGCSLAVAERHTHDRREQRLGAPLRMTGAVTAVGPVRIGVYIEIANVATGDVAVMFNLELELRRDDVAEPPPPAFAAAAAAGVVDPPPRSRPRSLPSEN